MKRKWLCVVALALAAVLCTGCGVKDENLKSDPLVNADGTAPVGKTLVAPAPPEDFTLLDNKDILAANGLEGEEAAEAGHLLLVPRKRP